MEDNKRLHKNITVVGRVQGVGFRFSALKMANSLSIKGFVMNKSDGTVYIEAEGYEEQISEFLYWCNRGPGYSNVKDILVEDSELKGYKYFDIKH